MMIDFGANSTYPWDDILERSFIIDRSESLSKFGVIWVLDQFDMSGLILLCVDIFLVVAKVWKVFHPTVYRGDLLFNIPIIVKSNCFVVFS